MFLVWTKLVWVWVHVIDRRLLVGWVWWYVAGTAWHVGKEWWCCTSMQYPYDMCWVCSGNVWWRIAEEHQSVEVVEHSSLTIFVSSRNVSFFPIVSTSPWFHGSLASTSLRWTIFKMPSSCMWFLLNILPCRLRVSLFLDYMRFCFSSPSCSPHFSLFSGHFSWFLFLIWVFSIHFPFVSAVLCDTVQSVTGSLLLMTKHAADTSSIVT